MLSPSTSVLSVYNLSFYADAGRLGKHGRQQLDVLTFMIYDL